jgi:uncharacterized coiled-coil DUF342 family protein
LKIFANRDIINKNTEGVKLMEEWKFDGSVWEFIDIMKWSLVVREARKRCEENYGEIMTNPALIESKSEEYGITIPKIAEEMVRIGGDMIELLKAADEIRRKNSESET